MTQRVLSQLAPFNEHRFNECMAFFTKRAGGTLTQYDLVKLHVLTDVFHVLAHGHPVIGGELQAWELGPVAPLAFNLVKRWAYQVSEAPQDQPEYFNVTQGNGKSIDYSTKKEANLDDFSECEMESMLKAWNIYSKMAWSEKEKYFHGDSFLGKAWLAARSQSRDEVSWDDIVDEYVAEKSMTTETAAILKRSIRL